MITLFHHALATILDQTVPLANEDIPLEQLVGRMIAEPVVAPCDLPRWDNSEMDGYAVRAEDCQPEMVLDVIGSIPAGRSARGICVKPRTAVRIMTGAPVPEGCDAVIPVEQTSVLGEDRVTINATIRPGDFIRFQGSDIRSGEPLIDAGTQLRPAEVSLLASVGKVRVPVYRRPTVAILSTGDELVEPGDEPGEGQIVDSNAWSLAAAVRELGAEPIILGIAKDDKASLAAKVHEGLQTDVLITSAGVSAGDRDLVREVLDEAGVDPIFWKVKMKPGGPTAFGRTETTLVFSLPGNPVSSMISFHQLVRTALLKMMGHTHVVCRSVKAQLKSPLVNGTGKLRFLRVRVEWGDNGLLAKSAGDQNTGILKTMLQANAIAVVPADCSLLEVGEMVEAQLLNPDQFFSVPPEIV